MLKATAMFVGCSFIFASQVAWAFDPNDPAYTCIQSFNGPSQVEVWVCLTDREGVKATNGDLSVWVRNARAGTRHVDISCRASYDTTKEGYKTSDTGGLRMTVSDDRPVEHYIIDTLRPYSRRYWKTLPMATCKWTIEQAAPKKRGWSITADVEETTD